MKIIYSPSCKCKDNVKKGYEKDIRTITAKYLNTITDANTLERILTYILEETNADKEEFQCEKCGETRYSYSFDVE